MLAGEHDCTVFKAALHACEKNFDSKVQAFERQAKRFEDLAAEMQAKAQSEMQLFKQDCERQVQALLILCSTPK